MAEPILDERTWRTRRSLLLVSTIAIAYSFLGFVPQRAVVLGIEFGPPDLERITFVLGLLEFYFLVAFLLLADGSFASVLDHLSRTVDPPGEPLPALILVIRMPGQATLETIVEGEEPPRSVRLWRWITKRIRVRLPVFSLRNLHDYWFPILMAAGALYCLWVFEPVALDSSLGT